MIKQLTVTVLAEDSVGYETPYLGQHGISLLIDAETTGHASGARGHGTESSRIRVLMDVAQHPEPLLGNMELMGIDPATIEMIVLTHCHYDHTRGLVRIIEEIGRPGLPVVAHPGVFRPNFEMTPKLRPIGVPPGDSCERIHAAGAHLMLTGTPLQLVPGLTTSGEVPRITSCEGANPGLYTIDQGAVVPDPMMDDLSIYAHLEEHGVIVLAGCSHAGIINIVRHARTVCTRTDTGAPPEIAAVMGGLHLITADPATVASTVTGLREERVRQVLAGHCTGFPAQAALGREFGEQFLPLYTGLVVQW